MKKWKCALLFLTFTLCLLFSQSSDTQAAVKLNKSSLSLLEGQSATLKLSGTKKTVTWKSSNQTVATVSKKGRVTAKAPGNAVISAKVGKTTKKCKLKVSLDYSKSYEYQIKYGKVTINKLLRISETDLIIPETIEGCPVTELADGLFKGCDGLVSITLPSGVSTIGDSAFYGCHTLREVNCSSAITSVGSYAFYECNALETLPDLSGIDRIGSYTFYNCDGLTAFPVALSLTSIGDYAFYDCDKLLTFFAPETLISIGESAFQSCDALLAMNGCKHVQTIGAACFSDCGQLGSVSLGDRLTSLGAGCFSGCEKINSISLPATLTAIPDHCFYNCYGITNLTLPVNLTKIGNMSFFNCIRLTILTIPGTAITSIAADAFAGVPLSNLGIWYHPSTPSGYTDNWIAQLQLQGLSASHIHTI